MRTVKRSSVVAHSADAMFALVNDVAAYPEFLPWCSSAIVHKDELQLLEATLELERAGLKRSFTTRNTLQPGRSITLTLVDGPFRDLNGGWVFEPLGDNGCRVTLDLEFEFQNPMLDMMIGPIFEDACDSMVDAFTGRADQVYD